MAEPQKVLALHPSSTYLLQCWRSVYLKSYRRYGLLLRLLGGSGITALYKTLRYTHKHDRAQLPPIFVQATVIAVIIFFLTHLVGVADIWLHAVASSIIVDFPNRLPPQDHILWSVGLNSSDPKAFGLCSPWTGSPWPCLDTPAGWADATDLNDTELIIAYTGWQTAYNITDLATFTTVQLPNQDNSALLMPWSAGTGANFSTYRATTYGANATCTIITNKCAKDSTSGLTTSCAPAGYPQLPVVGNFPTTADPHPPYEPLVNSTTYSASNPTFTFPSRVLGLVDGHIAGLVSGLADLPPASAITDNPTTTLLQLRWSSFYGNTPLPVISRDGNDPSFDTWPSGFHTLYAACSLEYFTANVTYDPTLPNAWSIESKALVDRNLTSILWSPLMSQYATESLSSEIMGFASSNTLADTTLKLEELLGRLAIAFPSGLFDPAPALSVDLIDTRILGLYPIGPIALLVSALYLYSLFAIFIFVTSQTASSYAVTIPADPPSAEEEKAAGVATPNEAPALGGTNVEEEADALALGQMWLTDPIAFISAMFPEGDSLDGKRSAMTDALLTHKDMTNGSQRLEMGVFGRGEETVFGIRTRGIQEGSG